MCLDIRGNHDSLFKEHTVYLDIRGNDFLCILEAHCVFGYSW